MKKIVKQRIAKALCACMALTFMPFFGCSTTEVTFEEYTDYDAFRFYCYYTPPQENVGTGEYLNNASFHTEEQFRYIAECGFNYAMPVCEDSVETVVELLEGLGKYGIQVYVADKALIHLADLYFLGEDDTSPGVQANKEIFKQNYEIYKQYDNFLGVHVSDEPNYKRFESLGKAYEFYRTVDPTREYGVNLLCYTDTATLGTDDFNQYITDALDVTGMSRLCFDSYPLSPDGVKQSHIANTAEIAQKAKDKGYDWDCFILTVQHLYYSNPTNYDDIAWQIYCAMAMGCRGIYPFTYMTPLNTTGFNDALIDRHGNRTQIYYSMQEVIREVRSFEAMYMNSEWTGTMYHVADSDYPNKSFAAVKQPLKSHDRVSKIKAKADVMLGTFKDKDGRDAFLLMNASNPADNVQNEVEITFKDATHAVLYKKGRRLIVKLDNGKFKTTMGSSEGYYIIPLNVK